MTMEQPGLFPKQLLRPVIKPMNYVLIGVLPLEVTKVWQSNDYGATWTIPQITPETSHQASTLCLNGSFASGYGSQSVAN